MGSPYLNSGETIALTTNRVVVEAIVYDVMLTTARIFLIDNRNPRFEPGEVPLAAILSVQGGKTPANDPVITILFRPEPAGGDARPPLNIVFTQNPGENRKPERDEWVRTIIQMSIAWQEKRIAAEAPPASEPGGDRGLQPAVRRFVAPDRVLPLSNVGHPHPATPATTVVMPDEVEGGGEIKVSIPPMQTQAKITPEPEMVQDLPQASGSDMITANTAAPVHRPPPLRARVIIPQIIEELLPGRVKPLPPPAEEMAGSDRNMPGQSFQNATRYPEGSGEPATEQPQGTVPVTHPEPAPGVNPTKSLPWQAPSPAAALSEPVPKPSGPELPSVAEETVRSEDVLPFSEPADMARIPAIESVSPADTIPERKEPVVSESGIPEQTLSPAPRILPETGPATVPETAVEPASTEVHTEPVQTEYPETDRSGISGTDADIPEENIVRESAVPQVTDIPCPDISPIPEPAAVVPVDDFPEPAVPSSPEIPRTSIQETHGPAEAMPSGNSAAEHEPSQSESGSFRTPPAGHPVPPGQQNTPGRTVIYAAVLLLIIALVAAGIMLSLPLGLPGNPVIPPEGTIAIQGTPETMKPATQTLSPVTTPSASSVVSPIVPQDGVWVEVNSTAEYIGRVGNPEQMKQFSGSGGNFYKIPRNDRPVQVSVQKQDNSGATLSVGIYRNGSLISTRSVTMPMGTIDLLIDPVTARAPGLGGKDFSTGHAVGRIENY